MGERRLLVTGGSGFLGNALCRAGAEAGYRVLGTWFSRETVPCPSCEAAWLDLGEEREVAALVQGFRPQLVIHTAYGRGDREITCGGTERLARACRELKEPPRFVQVSTDLVFDGRRGHYCEDDPAEPVMPYGHDKLDAERAVLEILPGSLVVRSSLMYDLERLPGHLEFAVEAIREGREFTFFRDEYRSPVLADELSRALLRAGQSAESGLLHLAGPDRVDRFSFGTALLKALGYDPALARAGTAAELGLARPSDCSLDSSRALRVLGMQLRGAREVLDLP